MAFNVCAILVKTFLIGVKPFQTSKDPKYRQFKTKKKTQSSMIVPSILVECLFDRHIEFKE